MNPVCALALAWYEISRDLTTSCNSVFRNDCAVITRVSCHASKACQVMSQLMEAAHASDEERDGSFEMRSPKRPRCYSTGPPKMAKAGILV